MKIKLLLLSANPRNTNNLRLAEEFRRIKESISRSKYRDKFEVIQGEAIRQKDLRRLLLDKAPHIVHFSGHAEKQGLFLEDEQGHFEVITGEKLEELFSLFESISCVVLNACYSNSQAKHLVNVVPYVIGMQRSIKDSDAIDFSEGFYDAIGSNRSIQEAFQFGVNAILGEEGSTQNRSLDTGVEVGTDKANSTIPVLLKGNVSRSLPNLSNISFKYKIPILLAGIILLGFVAIQFLGSDDKKFSVKQNITGDGNTAISAGGDVNINEK